MTRKSSSFGSSTAPIHEEDGFVKRESFVPVRTQLSAAERARRNLNARLANPLAAYTHEELMKMGFRFAISNQMGTEEDIRAFEMGAMLAQAPSQYERVRGLNEAELSALRNEYNNRWSQPITMYLVIVICSISAAVQGMGE